MCKILIFPAFLFFLMLGNDPRPYNNTGIRSKILLIQEKIVSFLLNSLRDRIDQFLGVGFFRVGINEIGLSAFHDFPLVHYQ